MHELFEEQVARTPGAVAVELGAQRMTYRELNERANELAHHLRELSVGPDRLVGLCMERSLEMIASALAVFKAGGACLPLDPAYPPERLDFMLRDAEANLVLTQPALADLFKTRINAAANGQPSARPLVLPLGIDDGRWDVALTTPTTNPPRLATSEHLAYVIYTSGSTGLPKGVAMPHRTVVNLVAWQLENFTFQAPARTLQFASLGFDICWQEMFTAWSSGATVVLVPEPTRRDPHALLRWLTEHQVERLFLPYVALRQLAEVAVHLREFPRSLREAITAGETLQLTPKLVQFFEHLDGCTLCNQYGPTECHVVTSFQLTGPPASWPARPPIGRPVASVELHLLDDQRRAVPDAEPGEVFIGGACVARGYLNRPDATRERFIADPHDSSGTRRWYRTGDLARRRPDGNLEFLGRVDGQVKIRGYRVELGEIETVLAQHPGVRQAVVVPQEPQPGLTRLVAYIVPAHDGAAADQTIPGRGQGERPLISEWRSFLQSKLPEFMVPSVFVVLDALPLTVGGKVDRKALPAPQAHHRHAAETYVAPQTELEVKLAELWAAALGLERVGARDNFFEMGGHSLLATQLLLQVHETLGVELPLSAVFGAPTVEALARRVEDVRSSRASTAGLPGPAWPKVRPAPHERHQPFPLTAVQQAYWLGRHETFELGNIATHVYFEVDGEALALDRLACAWNTLIQRHDVLRVIVQADGQQRILAEVPPYEIACFDLRGLDETTRAAQLDARRAELSHQVLPADRWPLFDFRASRLSERVTRLHLSLDILLADATSLMILFREWQALCDQPGLALPPLELCFRDYVLAEQALEETEFFRRSRDYWLARLDTLPPAPELPLARAPASIAKPRFTRRSFELERAAWQRLKRRAAQDGLTPSTVLLTAFAEVLAAWSRNPRFTLNLTLFNRWPLHPQANDLVGDFTGLLLLEADHSHAASFRERAGCVQRQLWQDLDHRAFNGTRLLHELARRQGAPRRALMPVVFTSLLPLGASGGEASLAPPFGRTVFSITQTPQVWLDHIVFEQGGGLSAHWDAVEELFPAGLLDDLFSAFCRRVQGLATEDPAWSDTRPRFLPPAQLAQREAVNATSAPVSSELLHTLFFGQADERPDALAVISPQRELTYRELADLSRRVGRRLRELGARPNQLVAVVLEKGWEQVGAVLGILASGAAYLPVDPSLPPGRRRVLLEHGEVKLALTTARLDRALDWPEGVTRLCLDAEGLEGVDAGPLEPVQESNDLAYVIFTSGSTGQPKGVMIDHRAALNTVLDINRRFGVQPRDRVLALSSLSFDLSVYDVFGLLATGGAVVLPEPQGTKDPAHWAGLMHAHGVTLWNTVPALMQMLVEHLQSQPERVPGALRLALLSGDWIPVSLPDRVRALWPACKVISLGGATEASIWSICHPIERVEPAWKSIPYGRPLANQTCHILNKRWEPCPVWVPDQLFIGGVGLARGYWRDEARTSESFILHPHTGERLYRTGDLARYLPDGNIELLGREDFQVKINGCRVELGEVETALRAHPAVKEAVVTTVSEPAGERRLVAFVLPESSVASAKSDGAPAPSLAEAREPLAEEGVLVDPIQRLEFKLKQPGIRPCVTERVAAQFPRPEVTERLRQTYLERQSFRQFRPEPVSLAQLGELLSCLLRLRLDDLPLPKARYPSAGSLYPVQVYLYVKPGRVEGLSEGVYYHHPTEHRLVQCGGGGRLEATAYPGANRAIFGQAAFALFLIAELDAITPLYARLAREFCLLEAGGLVQLLMTEAPRRQLGLCPIGEVALADERAVFGLRPSQVLLHSLLGGPIDPTQTRSWLRTETPLSREALPTELRAFLQTRLPDYMIPTRLVLLERLPLTPNGKVDRRALSALDPPHAAPAKESALPQSEMEKLVARLLQELVPVAKLGIHDNFFELGADSLRLVQLQTRLVQALGRAVPIVELFSRPTIGALAAHLAAAENPQPQSPEFDQRAARQRERLAQLRQAYESP
jgi:amino acid adenylation domain-containing protein